ncbi:MAG: PQQ-dependent sugar dehydrogenase, partial [Actinomycetota bacterium]|nr:PQQ-dependent sugar dehydrogenase [Actinomycetota bacterium]
MRFAPIPLVLVLFLLMHGSAAAALPQDFEARLLAEGLHAPTAIAWAPDGRLFVAEFSGRVRVVQGGELVDEPLIDISDHVNARVDRGVLGIAVDADFEDNHFLYLLYVYDATGSHDGGPKTSRLTRVVVRPDNTVANPESPETVILGTDDAAPCPPPSNDVDCLPADFISHTVGTVRADSDGTLWVGSGDAATAGQTDPNALRAYDETSLAGKIVHIDRDGRGLPGHPFCPDDADLSHTCTKVYAKGFRNPFRFALRDGGLGPIVGDVGNAAYDEINLTAAGANYGWPCWEGPSPTTYWEAHEACQQAYEEGGATPPDFAIAGAGSPNGAGHAILGGPIYEGGDYPDAFDGDIFFGDWSLGRVDRLRFGPNGPVREVFQASRQLSVVDLQIAPSGNVAWVNAGDFSPGTGKVEEIVYCPENCAPVARATATPTSGDAPLSVAFDSDGSADSDGDPLAYEWDFGDGTAHSTQTDPVHEYTRDGVFVARLTVTDPGGRSGTATVPISVGNAPPVPRIDLPDDFRYVAGVPVEITGSATDPEEGLVDPETLSWQIRLHHGDHVHPFAEFSGPRVAITAPDDHDADSFFEIVLRARDAAGLEAEARRELRPRT